jgi:serine/threonine protein kinase
MKTLRKSLSSSRRRGLKKTRGGSKIYNTNGQIRNLNEKFQGIDFFRKMGGSSREHAIAKILQEHPHPNIVNIYQVKDKYIDIEMVKPITDNVVFPDDQMVLLVAAMRKAKDHLQSLGIMYVDWKPDNAGLSVDGQYKLFDFDASGIVGKSKKWNISPPVYYWSYSQAVANGKTDPVEIDDFAFDIGLVRKDYTPIIT